MTTRTNKRTTASKASSKSTTASKAASKATTASKATVDRVADAVAAATSDKPATATTADFTAMLGEHKPAPAVAVVSAAGALPKCAAGRIQRGRPHPSLLYIIERKGLHSGKADRIKRWHKYEEGMSLLHCRITEGLDHLDIGYYTRHKGTDGRPLMDIRPMTDAEVKAAVARWEGEAVDEQSAAGSKPEGGTMNASDSAQ